MSDDTSGTNEFCIDKHCPYTLAAAAKKLGRSEWSVRALIRDGKLAHLRHTPKGAIYILGSDLTSYLESLRTPAIGERGRRAAQAAAAVAGK